MTAFVRGLWLALVWLRKTFNQLWGWDFFISYAWKDGQEYAKELKKELEQGRPRFDCFVDVFVLDGSEALEPGIIRHLRRSSALVLIGSPGALDPLRPRIQTEIEFFVDARRPIHTIRLGDVPLPVPLTDRPWITERAGADKPSSAVLLELKNKFEGLRQREWRFRVLMAVVASVALVVFVLGLGFYFKGQEALALGRRLKTAGIVRTAEAARDPLVGSLLLNEVEGDQLPSDAVDVARRQARIPIPFAVLRGHTEDVTCVAFDPSGAKVLTGSHDGRVLLWPADGRGDPDELLRISSSVRQAVFRRQATQVAVVGGNESIHVIRVNDREPLASYKASLEPRFVTRAYFCESGRWTLLDGASDGFFAWDLEQPQAVQPVQAADSISLGAWLGDEVTCNPSYQAGKLLYADGTLWDLHLRAGKKPEAALSRRLVAEGDFVDDANNSDVFSPDGRWVAARIEKAECLVWSVSEDAAPRVLYHPGRPEIMAFRFSSDGQWLLTTAKDGTVAVWSTLEGERVRLLDTQIRVWAFEDLFYSRTPVEGQQGGRLEVRGAVPSADGSRVVTLGADRAARLWDVSKETPPRELRLHLLGKLAAFSADGSRLAVSDANEIRVWSTRPPAEPLTFTHPKRLFAGALAPDRKSVLTGCEDGIARIWSLTDPGLPQVLDAQAGAPVRALAYAEGGGIVAVYYGDGMVRLWNTEGRMQVEFSEHRGEKIEHTGVRFSPNQQHVLTCTAQTARVWRIDGKGRAVVARIPGGITDAAFDLDGSRVVTAHEDGTARVWSSATGQLLFQLGGPYGHRESLLSAVFSPDGRYILTASQDGTARLWRQDGHGRPTVFQDDYHDSAVDKSTPWISAVAFSPTSNQLATASMDGRILLWNVNCRPRPRLLRNPALEQDTGGTAHIGPITYLAFSPDGRALASCDGILGQALVWQIPQAERPVQIQPAAGATLMAEFVDANSRLVTLNEGGTVQLWRVGWPELVRYLGESTSATLLPQQRIRFLGESQAEARHKYEAAERDHGRTPLPEGYPYVELDR